MVDGAVKKYMNDTDTTPPLISTAGAEILYSSNDKMMPRARHFDRSGAEWRNLTPHGTGCMAAGVLSAQSLERSWSPHTGRFLRSG